MHTWEQNDFDKTQVLCAKVEGDEMEEVARDLIAPPSEEESGEDEEEGELEGDATSEKSSIRKYRCVNT